MHGIGGHVEIAGPASQDRTLVAGSDLDAMNRSIPIPVAPIETQRVIRGDHVFDCPILGIRTHFSRFEEKVRDVVGLYLNPPDRALVLCVDEKSQIQALDRTAPILPLRPGLPERQTHDYKRHGTTTLFAAFNILNGKVIGTCHPRHRSREFVKFLNHLEEQLPADQQAHLILDNYCTHKSAAVQRWLKPKKRKRFHFHFTPTSSSWLNQVERFFALITGRMIRRGTFHSTVELETAIYKWLASWNGDPTPFVWKASADVILDRVRRCKELSKTGD
jgi:transposase